MYFRNCCSLFKLCHLLDLRKTKTQAKHPVLQHFGSAAARGAPELFALFSQPKPSLVHQQQLWAAHSTAA